MTALDLFPQFASDLVLRQNVYYIEYLPVLFFHSELEKQKVIAHQWIYANLYAKAYPNLQI